MTWQEPVVILVVAAAAVFVARRAYAAMRGQKSACGSGCGSCPSPSDKQSPRPLITIGPPEESSLNNNNRLPRSNS